MVSFQSAREVSYDLNIFVLRENEITRFNERELIAARGYMLLRRGKTQAVV
jgi:hypothetical protein